MSFRMKLATVTGAVVLAASGSGALANTDCGPGWAKAYGKLYKSLFSIAGKACKEGSGEAPGSADADKVEKMVEKVLKDFQKALNKAGDGNCPYPQAAIDAVDVPTITAQFTAAAETLAAEVCDSSSTP